MWMKFAIKKVFTIPKAIMYVVLLILFLAGSVGTTIPSASPAIVSKYEELCKKVPGLRWQDVYIYDYFKYSSTFTGLTDKDIENTINLFTVHGKYLNPKWRTVKITMIYSDQPEWLYRRVSQNLVIKIRNPLWHPPIKHITYIIHKDQPKYIDTTEPKTLLDVMTEQGFTSQDYQLAVAFESFLPGNDATSFQGDVTVPELQYIDIDPQYLYDYVHSRGSIFSLDDIKTIASAAQAADVNPALMVAITGQEESFVPTSWPEAGKIRNNPFNVYVSWQDYNTNLADAANIAAVTLHHKLATDPPAGEDAILWINDPNNPAGIYATDTHWAYGVEDIFISIENSAGITIDKQDLTDSTQPPIMQ